MSIFIQKKLTERIALGCASLHRLPCLDVRGRISDISRNAAQVTGVANHLRVGDQVVLGTASAQPLMGEVVSIRGGSAQVVPFDHLHGLGVGEQVSLARSGSVLPVADAWLGRVIDPLGRPLDGKGYLPPGSIERDVRVAPPPATERARLGPRLDLGVPVLDLFAPCREGQRLGLFAGSGIGKSVLLATLARFSRADVVVLALVGERGREVREFLEDDLGQQGLERSVVVVATSDAPPLMRRQAAYAAMAVAEHFRDQGRSVLLLVDSATRFCQALREVALAAGEAPATRGYPASVFAELPRLLERAGPGWEKPDAKAGQVTAFFTVLVDGDDHDEPVADAARGILDGHIILDRKIAEAGRFPPVDVLRSVSRGTRDLIVDDELELVRQARAIVGRHAGMADMIRLGVYQTGTDPETDRAIALVPHIEALLRQAPGDYLRAPESYARLRNILQGTEP